MYNLIKYLCEYNGWEFTYARRDFQNLYNEEEVKNKPLFFLDPIIITEEFDEYNTVINTNYSGSLMILVSSDIDEEDYDTRYQTYIKPIIDSTLKTLKEGIKCDGSNSINTWRSVEVINALDYNGDGVIVTFNVDGE